MKLGSLFSGSGGFELAGQLCGITPVWASEIEPFAIRVTAKHFPQMQHLGDIRQINATPVDIITAGFCCQDLSVAGKRAGLKGERSGLFYQIPRIVKGMLRETAGKYPRFVVLENVPGMYSSSGGNDFREVLNELIQIKNETLSVPLPENGKWSTSGEIVGDGFSIAWRTLDAQFWGVPQRRRRCYIVADFAGECAGKILFDESCLPRNPAQGGFPWQKVAGSPAACSGSNVSENITGTHSSQPIVFEPGTASRVGENVPLVLQGSMIGRTDKKGPLGSGISADVVFTPNTIDRHGVCYTATTGCGVTTAVNKASALAARDYKSMQIVNYSLHVVRRLTPTECALLQGFPPDWCAGLEIPNPTEKDITFWAEVWETYRGIVGTSTKPKTRNQIIKWLQSPHSDSAEYRMWGNSIALPCAVFALNGIIRVTEKECDNTARTRSIKPSFFDNENVLYKYLTHYISMRYNKNKGGYKNGEKNDEHSGCS